MRNVTGIRQLVLTALAGTIVSVHATTVTAQPRQEVCDYPGISAPEFVFSEADQRLQRFGYVLWHRNPSVLEEPLAYNGYAGRRGKLLADVIKADNRLWHVAVMQNCEKVYAQRNVPGAPFQGLKHLEYNGRVYFRSGLLHAKRLVNQNIWVNQTGLEVRQKMYTANPSVSYPLVHGQKLTVVGVDTKRYSHTKGVGPFFLRVRDERGQEGLLKFNEQYFFDRPEQIQMAGGYSQPHSSMAAPHSPPPVRDRVRVVPPAPPSSNQGYVVVDEAPVAPRDWTPPSFVDESPDYAVKERPEVRDWAEFSRANRAKAAPPVAAAPARPAKRSKPHNPTGYLVNVMSAKDQAIAERKAAQYRAKGFEARVSPATVGNKSFFRVQLGSYPTADDAREIAADLKAQGVDGAWVSNAPL